MKSTMVRWFAFLAVAVMIATASATGAVQADACNPTELSPCLPAITSPVAPSQQCCLKLQQQRPCLCGYLKNPSFRQYLKSPGAKRVASVCRVPLPSC